MTGSQNLLLMKRVTETLAGRAAMLKLLPLSQHEASGNPDLPLIWERKNKLSHAGIGTISVQKMWKSLIRGYYPELIAHPKRDHALWQASYLQTYLERDVRSLR